MKGYVWPNVIDTRGKRIKEEKYVIKLAKMLMNDY
jgi:hypothetical protein